MSRLVKISMSNSKMGKVYSVSLAPIATCAEGIPCAEKCYAMKSYRMYPNVRKAWNDNTSAALADSDLFFADIHQQLAHLRKPAPLFRWHVAGDITSVNYYANMLRVADMFPQTRFLAFTKQHAIISDYVLNNGHALPSNFHLYISEWGAQWQAPALLRTRYPVARVRLSADAPIQGVECSGRCDKCMHCFTQRENVYFNLH